MLQFIGYYSLLAAMALCVLTCAWIVLIFRKDEMHSIRRIGVLQSTIFGLVLIASGILVAALLKQDFAFAVVAEYTDSLLPWPYALTAFWAGQEGSFLFWTLVVTLFGLLWARSAGGRDMPDRNRCAFWMVYTLVQAFFLLIATTVSNPFMQLSPPPADGSGLNPLLQNPGMIFHPPLLFIGYAGLTIPAAAGLGTVFAADDAWLDRVRNWTLVAWTFLTAGIVLGGWWSYMELGWGGYWAWDPVENASLIPWLACSAFVHTAIIGRKGRALGRTNVALAGVSLVLCLLATFVTRSGMLDSLHAFGARGVGLPLAWAMGAGLLFVVLAVLGTRSVLNRELSAMSSRQGGMIFLTWLLLFVAAVIVAGTLWPLISRLWTADSVGLGAGFYNRVCLPFLALAVVILPFCPWLGWTTWKRHPRALVTVLVLTTVLGGGVWMAGIQDILPLATAAFALGAVASLLGLCLLTPNVRRSRPKWAVMGVHIGLAVLAFGIAVSGPYGQKKDAVLSPGEGMQIGSYSFTYQSLETQKSPRMETYQAVLDVDKKGHSLGRLAPERRYYRNFDQPFAEAAVIPGLGDELYATLLGFSKDDRIRVQVRVNPGVNWVWIGGTLMCLTALLAIHSRRRPIQS